MITYNEALKILSEYGQEHILRYYDELSDDEKNGLLRQIEVTDFSVINDLKTRNEESGNRGVLEPLGAVTIEDIQKNKEEYLKVGIEAIKAGKAAAVMLAGGQGTRLGFNSPKGMFNIGENKELYIFQCQINNLLDVVKLTGEYIPLYIMTSEKNNSETIDFFEKNNYFGYNSSYVKFFIQDMAPSVDFNGKIFMESKSEMAVSPNGNGGWFSSIVRAGLLDEIREKGIEWINVFAVDNVLQRIADPMFIGAVISSGMQSGSKVVSKVSPDERVGVLCLEDGKPSIVEYYEMTDEMRFLLDKNGELSYKYGVILNYLFNVNKAVEILNNKMPIHIVEKKIPCMNDEGVLVTPEKPNGFKFETLVLDMIHMQDNCLSYEVIRNKEFAPVKNATGADSVESARLLLKENGVEL
ncbi:MAG: UDPGP type 1 family protein [Ruminococcus sp.]|nr:UDPGP type 1 family protein [Ruminococcus sp.]